MDNLNDLKKLWLTADTRVLPDAKEMINIIKKYRNKKLIGKALLIFYTALLLALMVVVMFVYKSTMLTTRIGEACIIMSGLILIVSTTNSLKRIYNLKNCTNKAFVEHLQQAYYNKIYYYKKTQVVALLFNSIGLVVYMIEPIYKRPGLGLIVCLIAVVFLLLIWLVLRPWAFKRQMKKFHKTQQKVEELQKQLYQDIE